MDISSTQITWTGLKGSIEVSSLGGTFPTELRVESSKSGLVRVYVRWAHPMRSRDGENEVLGYYYMPTDQLGGQIVVFNT